MTSLDDDGDDDEDACVAHDGDDGGDDDDDDDDDNVTTTTSKRKTTTSKQLGDWLLAYNGGVIQSAGKTAGGNTAWRCTRCCSSTEKYNISGAFRKCLAHVAGGEWAKQLSVSRCQRPRGEDRERARKELEEDRDTKTEAKRRRSHHVQQGTAVGAPMTEGLSAPTAEGLGSHSVLPAYHEPSTMPPPPPQKRLTQKTLDKLVEKETHLKIVKGLLSAGVPLAALRNRHFREAYSAAARAGAAYEPPSNETARRLRGKVRSYVKERSQTVTSEVGDFGCTVIDDGWRDNASNNILNGGAVYNRGVLFVRSRCIDGLTTKDAIAMANAIEELIEKVGPANVVQVITDNASVMKKARKLIQKEYPHVSTSGCAAHAIDLFLEDLGKEESVKPTLDKARAIVNFVTNHGAANHAMQVHAVRRGETNGRRHVRKDRPKVSLRLVKHGETRFGTMLMLSERLLAMKVPIQDAFDDTAYLAKAMKADWKALHQEIWAIVRSAAFWEELQKIVDMLMPAFLLLRMMDGDTACTGKVYFHVWRFGEQLKKAKDGERLYAMWLERWTLLHSPLHDAGFCLDPEYNDASYGQEENEEVMAGFLLAAERILGNEDAAKALEEFATYRSKRGYFANKLVQAAAKTMPAHLWWKMHGASTPMLRKLAMRVLAQPASSSGCERFNSAGSHIMSVKQASMLTQNMETHLYVYHNLRVLDNIEQYDYVEQFYEWDESDSSDDEEVQVVEAPKGKGKEKSATQ
ncbi:DUF659 domain-containing protein [Pseudoscourfieldia marina]